MASPVRNEYLVQMTGIDTLVIRRDNEDSNWKYSLVLGSARWGDDLDTKDVEEAKVRASERADGVRRTSYYKTMKVALLHNA